MWPWAALVLLGAFHGVNPVMGWLFAVGLGLQERDLRALWRALVPIGLGHAASIGLVAALAGLAQALVEPRALRLASAAAVAAFGLYRLVRAHRHPRGAGMRVGFHHLTLWSFLVATAHGAGLMLLPALFALSPEAAHANPHVGLGAAVGSSALGAVAAVAVHAAAMVAAAGLVAFFVFQWVGLAVLRRGWVNLDLVWALVLMATGALLALSG